MQLKNLSGKVILVLGFFSVLAALALGLKNYNFLKGSILTAGQVYAISLSGTFTGRWAGVSAPLYNDYATFTTDQGTNITFLADTTIQSGYSIGQSISVRYDPENPQHAVLAASSRQWDGEVILVVIGLALIIFGRNII